jgi:hypothetical protein
MTQRIGELVVDGKNGKLFEGPAELFELLKACES